MDKHTYMHCHSKKRNPFRQIRVLSYHRLSRGAACRIHTWCRCSIRSYSKCVPGYLLPDGQKGRPCLSGPIKLLHQRQKPRKSFFFSERHQDCGAKKNHLPLKPLGGVFVWKIAFSARAVVVIPAPSHRTRQLHAFPSAFQVSM